MKMSSLTAVMAQRRSAWIAPLFAIAGCQPQPASTPDAEALTASTRHQAAPAPAVPTPDEVAERAARSRARDWLALVDGGQYDASWDAAANIFKSSTSKERWHDAVQRTRTSR